MAGFEAPGGDGNTPIGGSEVSNSPYEYSGTGSLTCPISDSYNRYYISVDATSTDTNAANFNMRLNGVTTSDYYWRHPDATTTTDRQFNFVVTGEPNKTASADFLTGTRFNRPTVQRLNTATGQNAFSHGELQNDVLEISQVTFLNDNSQPADLTVRIYGRTN